MRRREMEDIEIKSGKRLDNIREGRTKRMSPLRS